MSGINEFVETSGLIDQLQCQIVKIFDIHGVKGLKSENFYNMLSNFVSTVIVAYAVSEVCDKQHPETDEQIQEIVNGIVEKMSPEQSCMVVSLEKKDSINLTDKELMDMCAQSTIDPSLQN
jgi:putative exporter of polyketide antibiotics